VACAPYHAMYSPRDMTPPIRAASPREEAKQHRLLEFYLRRTLNKGFFEGAEGLAADLDETAIRQMRATYFGLMTEIDDCLGRVFAYLDETDQWKDTLIIFTSDHGEQLGDHHLLGKIGYFDESFRIPLVIKDPRSSTPAGRVEDAFTESIDVMPTIIDWLGGEAPRACDGASLLPFMQGRRPEGWRTELHYEYDFRDVYYSKPEHELGITMDQSSLCVVQDERFKYVHFAALPPLFFDLAVDPHQFHNLADDPTYAARVRDYAQKALSWRLIHADRTLTHFRATPKGLDRRGSPSQGETSWPRLDAAAF
jgi:arylsulfatase A-like enzyme